MILMENSLYESNYEAYRLSSSETAELAEQYKARRQNKSNKLERETERKKSFTIGFGFEQENKVVGDFLDRKLTKDHGEIEKLIQQALGINETPAGYLYDLDNFLAIQLKEKYNGDSNALMRDYEIVKREFNEKYPKYKNFAISLKSGEKKIK